MAALTTVIFLQAYHFAQIVPSRQKPRPSDFTNYCYYKVYVNSSTEGESPPFFPESNHEQSLRTD